MPQSPLPTSVSSSARSLDRRSLMRTAAWSVPAVTVASAAPAFARSAPVTGPGAGCTASAVLTAASWRVAEGTIDTSKNNTGWSTASGSNFTGGQVAAFGAQPAGAFVSFADNADRTKRAVVEVTYEFVVIGTVTLQLASNVTFGYGNSVANGVSAGYTDRQTAVVKLLDGVEPAVELAKFGLERVAAGGVQRPTGSSEARLSRPEADFATYQLFDAPDEGRAPHTVFSTPRELVSDSTTSRTVKVVYELTLDPRKDATVNDDIIIPMPSMLSCA